MLALIAPSLAQAQVNSGSNGSDGEFNPSVDTVMNMADHPDGIYQYTSINIPAGVTVTFLPNANNAPVTWLVQSNCMIAGVVSLNGKSSTNVSGALGGPGGYAGGRGNLLGGSGAQAGNGPGGGMMTANVGWVGGNASFAEMGQLATGFGAQPQQPPGAIYGNSYLLPLVGGSGGSGSGSDGGGGGGGAILIVVSGQFSLDGRIEAKGGDGFTGIVCGFFECWVNGFGGGGSGGAIRVVATTTTGTGALNASGGFAGRAYCWGGACSQNSAGRGRVRIDAFSDNLNANISAVSTRGFQPVIVPPTNSPTLSIQTIAGFPVAASPTGTPTTPDVIIPAQQANPISIAVGCANIPLNTQIIIDVKPASGATIQGVGVNSVGTQASSTATIQVNMPRGGGIIQAKAVSGIAGSLSGSLSNGERFKHYAQTGLTADGELFSKMEIIATLGRGQEITYITESGKRFVLPRN